MQNNNIDWEHKKYLAPKPVRILVLIILIAALIFAIYKISVGEFGILPTGSGPGQL
jgi:hypothetical protein